MLSSPSTWTRDAVPLWLGLTYCLFLLLVIG